MKNKTSKTEQPCTLHGVVGSVIDTPLQYCPKCRSLEIQQKTKSHDECKDCGHIWDIYRPWDNLS